jgi:Flp pilus assembly protein TadG
MGAGLTDPAADTSKSSDLPQQNIKASLAICRKFAPPDRAMSPSRFAPDCRGGVTPMFALLFIPLIAAIGAAVDYSMAAKVRSQLLAAADAASVGSVAKTSAALSAAAVMSGDGAIPAGSTDATKIFNAQLGTQNGYTLKGVTATVTKTGSTVTSTVAFTASVPTHFMGLFGYTSVPIKGTSSAANDLPVFIDFYLLLDNTPSMGVAATPADVTKMVNNTADQCAFACHDLSNSNDYYKLAKNLGVTMRIDVLRTATQQLMDTAKTTAVFPNQFRMAIYTFGASAQNAGFTAVQAPTSNLSTAKSAAAAIDLMTVPYQNYASDTDTNFGDVLTDANKAISTPGDGSNAATPQKYLFFVSDGVADRVNGSPGCSQPTSNGADAQTGKPYVRCQEPLDVSFCTKLKKRGVKIAVLYTTYLPLPTNSWYTTWIAPFAKEIAANMQACASPGLYFEVSPTQGISEAMNALFQKAVAQARLTK